MIIAIDGTFASGKGTLGKRLGAQYGLPYLDTGKLYRALAQKALITGVSLKDEYALAALATNISSEMISDPVLKSGDIGAAASKVAVHPAVRAALLTFQKNFATQKSGAVLDGRDIGTVICPNADVKLYVDAKRETRAERRFVELSSYGEQTSYESVLAQLTERDERDQNRAQAPLKIAADAHLLDTTDLSIDAAFSAAMAIIEAVLAHKG